MAQQLNMRKPVKIAHVRLGFEKGKEDGRGKVEVIFSIGFCLADENDEPTAYNGRARCRIEVWKPATFYPTYGAAFPTQKDLRVIEEPGQSFGFGPRFAPWLEANKHFFRSTNENDKGQIWCTLVTKPIKLDLDCAEYRCTYEVWFGPQGFPFREIYKGHKATYVSLDLNSD